MDLAHKANYNLHREQVNWNLENLDFIFQEEFIRLWVLW